MKRAVFCITLILFFTAVFETAAQSITDSPTVSTFDMTGFPQWAKDLRRFEIVAFGVFPLAVGVSSISYDIYRNNNPSGLISVNDRFQTTLLLAAGISLAVAFADFIIVKIKQSRERRRIESLPSGSVTIDRRPQDESGGEAEASPEE
jgi:hypothetical protein